MAINRQLLKFPFLLVGILLFDVSLIASWPELQYRLWGQTTNATITTARADPAGGPNFQIDYIYIDGTPRTGNATISPATPLKLHDSLPVQFIPGQNQSRPLATTNMLWVTLLALSTLLVIAMII